jgi:hypothetical protein
MMSMAVGMRVPMIVAMGMGMRHGKMLYYNITDVYKRRPGGLVGTVCGGANAEAARHQVAAGSLPRMSDKASISRSICASVPTVIRR